MKKIATAIVMMFTIGFAHAQSDSLKTKFDFYPDANVYYNETAKNYWFYDGETKKWLNSGQLPASIKIDLSSKKVVYYDGTEVWKRNANHQSLFGKKPEAKKP